MYFDDGVWSDVCFAKCIVMMVYVGFAKCIVMMVYGLLSVL